MKNRNAFLMAFLGGLVGALTGGQLLTAETGSSRFWLFLGITSILVIVIIILLLRTKSS